MGKLNRGNLLATLKKLKKMPRPKVVIANPAVQAICGGSSIKPNKTADLKASIERRRVLLTKRSCSDNAVYLKTLSEFNSFIDAYMRNKSIQTLGFGSDDAKAVFDRSSVTD